MHKSPAISKATDRKPPASKSKIPASPTQKKPLSTKNPAETMPHNRGRFFAKTDETSDTNLENNNPSNCDTNLRTLLSICYCQR